MAGFLNIFACVIIGLVLCFGAYTDWKTRTIPNWIPLVVLGCSFFTTGLWIYKFMSLALIILILLVCSKITKSKSGGGDIKLYLTLSFSLGVLLFGFILFVALIIHLVYLLCTHKKIDKRARIPLCVFLAPAYVFAFALNFVLPLIFSLLGYSIFVG